MLVAKDQETVRQPICIPLHNHGHRVLEAVGADEALAALASEEEQVVLLCASGFNSGMPGIVWI